MNKTGRYEETTEVVLEWLRLRKKLSHRQKIFLEIMTFAYMASNDKNSKIAIKKTSVQSMDNKNSEIVYEVIVNCGEV